MSTFRKLLLSAVVGSAAFTRLVPQHAPFESYGANFAVLFFVQALGWFTWSVILWPKLFTPLRRLPQPEVCSLSISNLFSLIRVGGIFLYGTILEDSQGPKWYLWARDLRRSIKLIL
jgi:hypothetical protein